MTIKGEGVEMFDYNRLKQISITLFILSLVMLIVHMESMIRFNRHEVEIHGNDDSGTVRMEIDARADSTSTWLDPNMYLVFLSCQNKLERYYSLAR